MDENLAGAMCIFPFVDRKYYQLNWCVRAHKTGDAMSGDKQKWRDDILPGDINIPSS